MHPPDEPLRSIIGRAARVGFRHRWLVAALVAATAATGAVAGWQALLLKDLLEGLAAVQAAWHGAPAAGDTDPLVRTGLLLLALAPATALAAWAACIAGRELASRSTADLRDRCLHHLLRLDLAAHLELARADLLQRLTTDLQSVLILQLAVFGRLVQRPVEAVFLLGFLAWLSPWLAAGVAALMVPVGLLTWRVRRQVRATSVTATESAAANLQVLEQVTAGIRVVKTHGSEDHERTRYSAVGGALAAARRRMDLSRARSEAVTQGSVVLLASLAMLGGAVLFAHRLIDPATLLAALGVIVRLTTALRDAHRAWLDVAENAAPAARVFALLERAPRVVDRPDAAACPRPRHAVRLAGVRFRHAPEADEVLRGVDLDIPIGSTIALVGESGGGKSTLLDLLARLHDPTGGAILIDGVDLRDLQRASWIAHLGVVPQDCFLFDATVRENIRYGRPDADDAAIEAAARRAHVHQAILDLEGGLGYGTAVGDRGCRLSVGQRQRVAIARAMLRDAPILLLDEPTSALDAGSEAHVQEGLRELMRGRTVIVAAHRLATVQHADRIAVLAGKGDPARGTVLELGTHAELVAAGGVYAGLVRQQRLA